MFNGLVISDCKISHHLRPFPHLSVTLNDVSVEYNFFTILNRDNQYIYSLDIDIKYAVHPADVEVSFV